VKVRTTTTTSATTSDSIFEVLKFEKTKDIMLLHETQHNTVHKTIAKEPAA